MPDLIAMIKEWLVLQEQLKTVKEKEAELRRDICEHIFAGKRKTVKADVGPYKVKAVYKINNKVDEAAYLALRPELTAEEQEAIKVKYDLIASKYKKLRETSLLHQCIISKPGMPTLEVKDGN